MTFDFQSARLYSLMLAGIGGHDLAARNWSVASVAHLDGLDLTAGLTLTAVSRVFRTEPALTQIDAPTLTV